MTPRRLLISFSGGETSAYMTQLILRAWRQRYDEIVVVFANTGEEEEACLEFVRLCDELLGFGTVWLEAVIHHGEKKGPTHRIVTFETASRHGEPFEEMIRKYGIPNPKFPHCTRVLKKAAILSYARSIGWEPNTYDTAIGIRADEIDRMTEDKDLRRVIYPLVKPWPTSKPQINYWWHRQPFRLASKGYRGNCTTCWKKSLRKLLTVMDETPEAFDFNRRMEADYGLVGAEFGKDAAGTLPVPLPPGYRRTFFRENRSVADLERLHAQGFTPAEDDSQPWEFIFDAELDVGGGCGESCEVWADDDSGDDIDLEAAA